MVRSVSSGPAEGRLYRPVASTMNGGRQEVADFAGVNLAAATVLQLIGGPAGLWSDDREHCLFNGAATALLGYQDADFRDDRELWLARVEPRDRDAFQEFCQAVRRGGSSMTCRYRFLPRATTRAVELQETAQRLTAAGNAPVIFSRYAGPGVPSDARGLVHKIGNHLQAIRGEVDLLRLSGVLPQGSGDSISRSIDAVHDLVAEMERGLL